MAPNPSPFAELFVEWPDHCPFADDAKSTHTNIGQVATDNCTSLDDYLAAQHDILGSTEHGLAADTVPRGLKYIIDCYY